MISQMFQTHSFQIWQMKEVRGEEDFHWPSGHTPCKNTACCAQISLLLDYPPWWECVCVYNVSAAWLSSCVSVWLQASPRLGHSDDACSNSKTNQGSKTQTGTGAHTYTHTDTLMLKSKQTNSRCMEREKTEVLFITLCSRAHVYAETQSRPLARSENAVLPHASGCVCSCVCVSGLKQCSFPSKHLIIPTGCLREWIPFRLAQKTQSESWWVKMSVTSPLAELRLTQSGTACLFSDLGAYTCSCRSSFFCFLFHFGGGRGNK